MPPVSRTTVPAFRRTITRAPSMGETGVVLSFSPLPVPDDGRGNWEGCEEELIVDLSNDWRLEERIIDIYDVELVAVRRDGSGTWHTLDSAIKLGIAKNLRMESDRQGAAEGKAEILLHLPAELVTQLRDTAKREDRRISSVASRWMERGRSLEKS